jgi:hypothetical protein
MILGKRIEPKTLHVQEPKKRSTPIRVLLLCGLPVAGLFFGRKPHDAKNALITSSLSSAQITKPSMVMLCILMPHYLMF